MNVHKAVETMQAGEQIKSVYEITDISLEEFDVLAVGAGCMSRMLHALDRDDVDEVGKAHRVRNIFDAPDAVSWRMWMGIDQHKQVTPRLDWLLSKYTTCDLTINGCTLPLRKPLPEERRCPCCSHYY